MEAYTVESIQATSPWKTAVRDSNYFVLLRAGYKLFYNGKNGPFGLEKKN